MKRLFLIPLLAAGIVAGCETAQVIQSVEYTCASATALVELATDYKAKMSESQKVIVTNAVAAINPVCSQEMTPTLDSTAHAALSAALASLTGAVQGVQK